MPTPTRRRIGIYGTATVFIVAMSLGALLYNRLGPPGRQARNMETARQHLPKVEPLLKQDARFAQVEASEYTGMDGSLGVQGYVKSEQDLADLKRIVASTSPPVQVCWMVRVLPSPEWETLFDKRPTSRPKE